MDVVGNVVVDTDDVRAAERYREVLRGDGELVPIQQGNVGTTSGSERRDEGYEQSENAYRFHLGMASAGKVYWDLECRNSCAGDAMVITSFRRPPAKWDSCRQFDSTSPTKITGYAYSP